MFSSSKFIIATFALTIPTRFSSLTSKVNILHCYEFMFGLVEMKLLSKV
jgi:hypothetical protein